MDWIDLKHRVLRLKSSAVSTLIKNNNLHIAQYRQRLPCRNPEKGFERFAVDAPVFSALLNRADFCCVARRLMSDVHPSVHWVYVFPVSPSGGTMCGIRRTILVIGLSIYSGFLFQAHSTEFHIISGGSKCC